MTARQLMLATGAVGGAAGAAWIVAARRDARRLAADPERTILDEHPACEEHVVTAPDGTRLHVELHGPAGAPPLVLVHGWGMSARFWHYQLRDLASEFRVVAYDQRGHGRSTPSPQSDYGFSALAGDLDLVLRAFANDPRAVVVGHSIGGMTALAWAGRAGAQVPRRIAAAVLLNTTAETAATTVFSGLAVARAVAQGMQRRVVTAPLPLPRRTSPVSNRITRRVSLSPHARPAHVALTERLFFDCPTDVRSGFGITLTAVELTEDAAALKVSTIVVTSDGDRLVSPRFSERLVERLPDARLVSLGGAGHQTPLERAAEVTDLIRAAAAGAPLVALPLDEPTLT